MTSFARVSDLAEQIRGVTYGKGDALHSPRQGYVPILRAGNISDEGLTFDDLVYVPAERVSSRQRIRRNDIVIAASSGSIAVVGKAARVCHDFDGSFGAFCKVLRPGPSIDPGYFAHYFRTRDYRRRVSALAAGIGINNLRNEHLDQLELPIPALSQQRQVANILDEADAIRAKRHTAIALSETLTQSIFRDMFGDPATNSKGWPTAPLGSLCSRVTDGTHQPPKWAPQGIPFLFVSNITSGEISFETKKFISEETHSELMRRCPIDVGDILYTTVGSYGVPAVVRGSEKFAFQRHIAHLKPDRKLLVPEFLQVMLASPSLKQQATRAARGIAQKTVNLSDIREFSVFRPPLNVQKALCARIDGVEKLKNLHVASLARLEELCASLRERAFRGGL